VGMQPREAFPGSERDKIVKYLHKQFDSCQLRYKNFESQIFGTWDRLIVKVNVYTRLIKCLHQTIKCLHQTNCFLYLMMQTTWFLVPLS